MAESGLVDIVAPLPPPQSEWAAVAIAALIVLVLLTAAVVWLRSPRRRALHRLRRLRRALRKGHITPRQGAYEVAATLASQQVQVPRHEPAQDGVADSPEHRFWRSLERYRYAPSPPRAEDVMVLIEQAHRRLRAWAP